MSDEPSGQWPPPGEDLWTTLNRQARAPGVPTKSWKVVTTAASLLCLGAALAPFVTATILAPEDRPLWLGAIGLLALFLGMAVLFNVLFTPGWVFESESTVTAGVLTVPAFHGHQSVDLRHLASVRVRGLFGERTVFFWRLADSSGNSVWFERRYRKKADWPQLLDLVREACLSCPAVDVSARAASALDLPNAPTSAQRARLLLVSAVQYILVLLGVGAIALGYVELVTRAGA